MINAKTIHLICVDKFTDSSFYWQISFRVTLIFDKLVCFTYIGLFSRQKFIILY